jgi:hypothetical protein
VAKLPKNTKLSNYQTTKLSNFKSESEVVGGAGGVVDGARV